MNVVRSVGLGVAVVIGLGVVVFLGFLGYIVVTDYRPDAFENAREIRNVEASVPVGVPIRVTTFNIGYAGLDAGQDFFMDGGIESRSRSLEQTLANIDGILRFLSENDADIYALQEVDERASRSFDTNQIDMITDRLGSPYGAWFAYNYRARWVPVPVTKPMGYAYSGLLTFSRFRSSAARRYALPGVEPFPKRYFDLKRAVLENVFPVENGRSLYFINLHLSAFDEGGLIRAQQIEFLIDRIAELYRDGHYVVLAGDWNHLLDMSFLDRYHDPLPDWVAFLPAELLALDFTLAFDSSVTTVRDNVKPYVRGENFETIIDGFFVSNNVTVIETIGTDLRFEHSDHNPVTVTLLLQ